MTKKCSYSIDYEKTDKILFQEFQKGDLEAFSEFYDRNVNVLFNYGCKLMNDRELVEDCIHDVFIKIYKKREDLSSVKDIRAYLFVAMRNKIYDELRKKNHWTDRQLEDYNPVATENVEHDYLIKEKESFINCKVSFLLDKLSLRQREAITLYYIEERKYEEICEIMDINYQSLRNLIHRSLTRLRAIAV